MISLPKAWLDVVEQCWISTTGILPGDTFGGRLFGRGLLQPPSFDIIRIIILKGIKLLKPKCLWTNCELSHRGKHIQFQHLAPRKAHRVLERLALKQGACRTTEARRVLYIILGFYQGKFHNLNSHISIHQSSMSSYNLSYLDFISKGT